MKIKVERGEITQHLQDVIAAIPSRSTLPILSNLLLEAEENKLFITATDLEICIRKKIDVEVIQSGKITALGKKFYDILKEIPSDNILIEETKNFGVILRAEKCYFKLLGFSPQEYPDIPKIEGKSFKIDAKKLASMISKTYFACSKEETRYVLNGILFDFNEDSLSLVASDGRRLALCRENIKTGWSGKYIVPQKAVLELLKMSEKTETPLTVSLSEKNNQMAFSLPKTELITRLIEGDFPKYEEVIPQESDNKLTLNTKDFFQAIKRANLMTTTESVVVKIEVYKDKVVISKVTPELGEGCEELEADYKGEEIIIGFNPQYLLDILKNIDQSEIVFELNGVDKPGIIRIGSTYLYLVLPMQLM
ncbi:MAG: DNA polymerase III subunit beta [Candidatus Kaelpia imicola]|nr:DNA polymerase III subunit beta [Candidatus Kaelpia imicola]